MVLLRISVNFSTMAGHDSVNRFICENKSAPNATMTKKVRNKAIIMATILLIFNRTKKFTTGWSTMAIMIAKTRGIITPFAIYSNINKPNRPMSSSVAFAYRGNLISLIITGFSNSLIRLVHEDTGSFLWKTYVSKCRPNNLIVLACRATKWVTPNCITAPNNLLTLLTEAPTTILFER